MNASSLWGGCRKAESPCIKDKGQRCFNMHLKVFRAGAEAHDRPGGEGRAGERLFPCTP